MRPGDRGSPGLASATGRRCRVKRTPCPPEGRSARHAQALAEEGSAHVREGARRRRRGVRQRGSAHRTAWSAVKHSFEKVGDHWEAKDEKGPSDAQAAQRGAAARDRPKQTSGGVDESGNTKEELYERAKRAGVKGRSKMSKQELAKAVARNQD